MSGRRDPPHDLGIESSLLGAVLSASDAGAAWSEAREHLPHPLAFYGSKHRKLALALDEIADRGGEPNAEAVQLHLAGVHYAAALRALDRLERVVAASGDAAVRDPRARRLAGGIADGEDPAADDSLLAHLGGVPWLLEITKRGLRSSVPAQARRVADLYRRRQALDRLKAAEERLRRPDADVGAVVGDLADRLLGVSEPGAEVSTLGDAVRDLLNADPADAAPIAVSGIRAVDGALEIGRGHLVALGADTGAGKTSLALTYALNTARAADFAPGSVLVVSREMTRRELASVAVAQATGLTASQARRGWLGDKREAIADRAEAWAGSVILLDTNDRLTVGDVCRHARHVQRRHGNLRLVVVDYLQLLDADDERENEVRSLSRITRRLKRLAMDTGVAVLLLSQLSRKGREAERSRGEVRRHVEPSLADFRGSGSIEQDANACVLLWAPEGTEDEDRPVVLRVAKNRAGRVARVPLRFHGPSQTFRADSTREGAA